ASARGSKLLRLENRPLLAMGDLLQTKVPTKGGQSDHLCSEAEKVPRWWRCTPHRQSAWSHKKRQRRFGQSPGPIEHLWSRSGIKPGNHVLRTGSWRDSQKTDEVFGQRRTSATTSRDVGRT